MRYHKIRGTGVSLHIILTNHFTCTTLLFGSFILDESWCSSLVKCANYDRYSLEHCEVATYFRIA